MTESTRCQGRVEDPTATWDAIEIGQDTMPCPRSAVPGSDRCRSCTQLLAA